MRILLVANTLPPRDLSGVGEQVLQLAGGLERAGHEVEIVGRGGSGPWALKLLFPLTVIPRFLRAWRRFDPDVVQVHESDGAFAAYLTRTLRSAAPTRPLLVALQQVSYVEERRSVRPLRADGRVLGRPSWSELRFKYLKAPLQIALGRLSAHLADLVLAPSRTTAGELERDYLVEAVGVVPNVLGGREVAPRIDESVGEERGFLLYVGRLRVRKGLEVLLEGLRSLGERAPRTLVVGDGEHRHRLERAVRELGLQHRVALLGRRSPEEVRFLMERAGALVVPSIYEGMPLVVLEAMAAALPVIASAVSGIPEVVEEGVTGWLVAPEDPAALAEVIETWRGDPVEARRRGAAGARRLGTEYTADRAAEIWLERVVESGARLGPQSESPRNGSGRGENKR